MRILFLHNNTLEDGLTYALICDMAKQASAPVTAVDIGADNALNLTEAALKETGVTMYFASKISLKVHTLLLDVEYDPNNVLQVPYTSPASVAWTYTPNPALVMLIYEISEGDAYSLPCVMAYLLMNKLGLIDFGNYLAEHVTYGYDIARDGNVVDILDPR